MLKKFVTLLPFLSERLGVNDVCHLKPMYNVEVGRENYYYKTKPCVKGKARFGSYCAIGENLRIITQDHNIHLPAVQSTFYKKFFNQEYPKGKPSSPVYIGSDVWLGDNVTILKGVTIGDGACIGAESLVTKDVPAYSIAAGVPVKVIKHRFKKEVREFLLETRWWDWPQEKIRKNREFFNTDLSSMDSPEEIKKIIK